MISLVGSRTWDQNAIEHFQLRTQPILLPTHPPYIVTEPTPLTRLIAVDPSCMHMLRHTTHDTLFDQYCFTLPHAPRRVGMLCSVHPTALALTYTHADLPDNIHASFFRLRMSPFDPRDPPAGRQDISQRAIPVSKPPPAQAG